MKLICKDVKNRDDAARFVALCEEEFEQKLRLAARDALSRGNKIITLAGPTCSGKTTTAALLLDEIEKAGKNAVVISIDDFYLDDLHANTHDGMKPDFDSAKTIDLEYLAQVIGNLTRGESTQIPKFDFMTGRRGGYTNYHPMDDDIYIFEGIQAVYPEVVTLLGDRYTSVFICVKDDVMFNGVYFSAHEVRLLRRIVRDALFRNTSPAETLFYWESVRVNEDDNIFPNAMNPHVVIDSFLMYEIFIIAPLALSMLRTVPMDSKYFQAAVNLMIRLEKINGEMYDSSLVPKNSIFREFIG